MFMFCLYSDVTMYNLGEVIIDGKLDSVEHLTFGHNTFIRLGDEVRRLLIASNVVAMYYQLNEQTSTHFSTQFSADSDDSGNTVVG